MSQSNKSTVGDSLGDMLRFLIKALIKIVLLLFVGVSKLIHRILGMFIEFLEKRLE